MAAERPNIVLLTTAQHRGDFIGLAGHPVVETPNLDGLIGQGAYFPNAHTEIPSTTGARRVLLGGQASHVCGLIGYHRSEWHEPNTLAACLADAGYHCINVGWRNLHPCRKLYGFHTVIPHDGREGVDDYWDWLKERVGPEVHERESGVDANGWLGRPWSMEERFHPTNWTVMESLRQVKRRDPTRPFFLWCSQIRPHSPYDPPPVLLGHVPPEGSTATRRWGLGRTLRSSSAGHRPARLEGTAYPGAKPADAGWLHGMHHPH